MEQIMSSEARNMETEWYANTFIIMAINEKLFILSLRLKSMFVNI